MSGLLFSSLRDKKKTLSCVWDNINFFKSILVALLPRYHQALRRRVLTTNR